MRLLTGWRLPGDSQLLRNFPRKTTTVIGILFILTVAFSRQKDLDNVPVRVARHYLLSLETLRTEMDSLVDLANKRVPLSALKDQFHSARYAFKKIALLIEYFNPVENRLLNRPAIDALQPGAVDKLVAPSGFQYIEQELFGDFSADSYALVSSLGVEMIRTLEDLSNQQDLVLKFREELVWDALRSSVLQLMTTGIAGFDSPIALASLPEACGSLEGICDLLDLFDERLPKEDIDLIKSRIQGAGNFLARGKSFDSFDRLEFIRSQADAIYQSIVQVRKRNNISFPPGSNGINFNAESIFTDSFFKMDFFGPSADYGVTEERIRLGKKLFGDPILSGERNRSCASCHYPNKGFTDGLAKPYAIDNVTPLLRNSPTLWNAGLQTKQFWDSRVDILENQLGEVVHNLQEMQGSLGNSVNDLKGSVEYLRLFNEAYPLEKNPVNRFTIANAIATYVRSLRSLDSKFDRYISGRSTEYSASEKNGFNLFMGKAKCGTCHFLPLFNGVVPPIFTETESEVLGVPSTKDKRNAKLDGDRGKYDYTKAEIHRFAFKTPGLRNVELTGPYMHNGVFNTLEEVIDFYNEGGGTGLGIAPPNQTLPPEKLKLSKKEKANLVHFLKSLTDTTALTENE